MTSFSWNMHPTTVFVSLLVGTLIEFFIIIIIIKSQQKFRFTFLESCIGLFPADFLYTQAFQQLEDSALFLILPKLVPLPMNILYNH